MLMSVILIGRIRSVAVRSAKVPPIQRATRCDPAA